MQYQPLPQARYDVEFCKLGTGFTCTEVTGSTGGYTNDEGYLYLTCTDDDEYYGAVKVSNPFVRIVSPSAGGFASVDGDMQQDCGQSIDVYFNADQARVYVNMTRSAQGSQTFFQQGIPQIRVDLDPNADNSYYSPSEHRIYIRSTSGDDHIWGTWGVFIAGHEFGHAFHDIGLSGNEASGQCPSSGHKIDGAHNLQCAFSEGFANYHASISRNDLSSSYYAWPAVFEADAYFPGCNYSGDTCVSTNTDGSIIEGAVAAFLFDVTDNGTESHDGMALPGSYVREVITTCQVDTGRADGIDHIIACMENQVDSPLWQSYFGTRSPDPISQQEGASEPSGWSVQEIRDLWVWNLYDKS